MQYKFQQLSKALDVLKAVPTALGKNGQRTWVNISVRNIYRWPISTWKEAPSQESLGKYKSKLQWDTVRQLASGTGWKAIHPFISGSMAVCMLLLLLLSCFSRVRLCATPETAAHQAPPSLGFSGQEHWSGLPLPSKKHESEKWKWSPSVVSDSQWPHGLQPTRLLCPWDFPGAEAKTTNEAP